MDPVTALVFAAVGVAAILLQLEKIMTEQSAIVTALVAQKAQLTAFRDELLAALARLQETIDAANDASPELIQAAADLGVVAQSLDDIVLPPPPAP